MMPSRPATHELLAPIVIAASAIACSAAPGPAPLDRPDATSDATTADATADGRHDALPARADARRDAEPERRDASRDGPLALIDARRDAIVRLADAGTPTLTELSVSVSGGVDAGPTVDASASTALVPTFASDNHDYYVRCGAGANAVTVSMAASPGSTTLLLRPTTSATLPAQTVSLTLNENQAIVAAATDGTATTEYWVRCLPHDFPHLRMTLHADAGSPPPGYYLVGDFLPAAPQGAYAMVLDVHGVPVWYALGSGGGMGDVDHVVSEGISFIAFDSPAPAFEVQALDPLSTTYLAPSGALLDGHELQVAPDGTYVVISNPVESGVDLTGLTVPLPDGGVAILGGGSSIQGCNVVEFDPGTGAVTWQWTGSEHLDPVLDSTLPALGTFGATGPDGGLVVDPFHCNSVDVDPGNGNLLVSARNMDSVFYVDRVTGAILWKMGGATFTRDGAAYVTLADPFYRQHDARLVPGWSAACGGGTGQISMFDDESQRPAPARGVVYDVVVGASDGGTVGCDGGGAAGTATVAWQYEGAVSSSGIGSFRVSSDGSRIIGWGYGAPGLVFTEVDVGGADLSTSHSPTGTRPTVRSRCR